MSKHPPKNDASYCRLKGWAAGTVLTVEIDYRPGRWHRERVRITAVGEAAILVRRVYNSGREAAEEKWCRRLLDRAVVAVELPPVP